MGMQPNQATLEQELQEIRKPLESWRSLEGVPNRIPEEVWGKATELAARHGVGIVAAGLHLNHSKLKRKVEALKSAETRAKSKAIAPGSLATIEPAFVELFGTPAAPGPTSQSSCVLQVESPRGARLRMEVGGLDAVGLALLLKEFA